MEKIKHRIFEFTDIRLTKYSRLVGLNKQVPLYVLIVVSDAAQSPPIVVTSLLTYIMPLINALILDG